jgi:hypothetical protein
MLNFIGNVVGPHHPLLAWVLNFSHAQQGQLLPMSGEQTVGVGGMRICGPDGGSDRWSGLPDRSRR